MSNYNWNREEVKQQNVKRERDEKHLTEMQKKRVRMNKQGYSFGLDTRQKAQIQKDQMDRMLIKVKKVMTEMSEEDKEQVFETITETEKLKVPRKKILARRDKLFPLYRKYVDPNARLSGCSSCIQAQSKFFEVLAQLVKDEQKSK